MNIIMFGLLCITARERIPWGEIGLKLHHVDEQMGEVL
jgi:hypothetical protein